MFKQKNKTLLVLSLVMVVNALSYGILIPLLYPYAARFGLDAAGLGFLFAAYSFFQFLATPVIGRMSDRFGRKPLLIISLLGTSVSLVLFASAGNMVSLFLARILDGVTGGNNSVAQAVIADSTAGKDRAKSFGIIGASYGFGFLIGPALGGLLGGVSLTAPFWVASVIAFLAALLCALFLQETNTRKQEKAVQKEGLFNFERLVTVLKTPVVGSILLIILASSIGHNSFVVGFQSFSVDALHLSTTMVGLIFSMIGLLSVIMQSVGIRFLLDHFKSEEKLLKVSLFSTALMMVLFYLQKNVILFVGLSMTYILFFAPQMVLGSSLISHHSQDEDQGGILGISQSYLSLGQIIGPVLAGGVIQLGLPLIFLAAGGVFFIGAILGAQLHRTTIKANL